MQIGAIRPMNFKCMNTVSFKGEENSLDKAIGNEILLNICILLQNKPFVVQFVLLLESVKLVQKNPPLKKVDSLEIGNKQMK